MTFKTALRSRIKTVADRVDWGVRPQGTALPCVVLSTVFGSADQHFEGLMAVQYRRIDIKVLATTQAEAEAMRIAVQAVIEAGATSGGITFQRGFVNRLTDGVEDTETGQIFREVIDATIWFN